MSGRIIGVVIVAAALIGGALVYYLQVYAFYEDVPPDDARTKIALTAIHSGAPEALPVTDFQGIDADSSPLRYRACFQVANSLAMLTETFVIIDNAVPLQAPAWFDCFDATDIGEALEEGRALAFLGQAEVADGVDRVVAVMPDGRGFAWHQLNDKYAD